MAESYEQEQARILELKARAQDAIDNFFEENPEADWLWVGENTATVYDGGTDEELPTPEVAEALEQEKGEPLEIFGRDIFIDSLDGLSLDEFGQVIDSGPGTAFC